MRLILLLAAMVIVGLLMTQQLNRNEESDAEQASEMGGVDLPKVPTNPGDVPKFEADLNRFIEEEAARQAEKIDQATQ